MEQEKVIFWIKTSYYLSTKIFIINGESTGITSKLIEFMAKNEIDTTMGFHSKNFDSEIYKYESRLTLEETDKIRTWLLAQGATEK